MNGFHRWSVIIYGTAIFLSAGLMFLVQPMFAKALLPLLGGAPAVWNTCVVFYELILLAGYFYAFVFQRRLALRTQVLLHLLLVLLVFFFLPLRVLSFLPPPTSFTAVPWLLVTLLISLGIPLFVLSATSPLLQSWFARTPDHRAADPYFLYAASNAGSLLGLLCYPFGLEPFIGLHQQSVIWTIGYIVLVVFLALSALIVYRSSRDDSAREVDVEPLPAEATGGVVAGTPDTRRKVRWIVLAFIPASLMLSATNYLAADVAPIPLMWVLPLALYLVTFIVAFSGDAARRLHWLYVVAPAAALFLVVIVAAEVSWTIPLRILIHLTAFYFIALTCHSSLAADRPTKEYLTEFYLYLATGGALGGIFTAIIAPIIFNNVFEYPLVLVLAAYFLRNPVQPAVKRPRLWDYELPLLLAVGLATYISLEYRFAPANLAVKVTIAFFIVALVALVAFRRPMGFAVFVAGLTLCGVLLNATLQYNLFVGRNFFGVKTVQAAGLYHYLLHGTTTHGIENMQAAHRDEPLAYYARTGPLGQIFSELKPQLQDAAIAVVGEGAGAALCYHTADQRWTIYEIDPIVDRVARDAQLFAYIPDCARQTPTVIGDARLSLGQAADGQYSLMILDAYSADYVPLHLLTREALDLYLRKSTKDGVLAFHTSSKWFDLVPVLTALARDAGVACYVNRDRILSYRQSVTGKRGSIWVVLGPRAGNVSILARDPRWQPCPETDFRVWTDDYSSLVTAFGIHLTFGSQ